MTFDQGSHAFIIESSRTIREVVILQRSGDFYTVKFADSGGGIKVRGSRLYPAKEDAEAALPKKEARKTGYRSPYDYWH